MHTGVLLFVFLCLVALSTQQSTTGLLAYPTYTFPDTAQQITLVATQFGVRTQFTAAVPGATSYSLIKIGFFGDIANVTGTNYVGVYSDVTTNSALLASGTFTSGLTAAGNLRYEVSVSPALPLPTSGSITYYLSFWANGMSLLSPGNAGSAVLFATTTNGGTPSMPATVSWTNANIPASAQLLQPAVYYLSNVTLPLSAPLSVPQYPLLPDPFTVAVNPKPVVPKNKPV